METFNASERLKQFSRQIDLDLAKSDTPLRTNEVVEEPKYIQQPTGPLFAVYKRTPEGYNKVLFSGLTKTEAERKYEYLNTVEQAKRRRKEEELNNNGLEYIPDAKEVIFFDIVEMGTIQENPYWNSKEVTK